MFIISSYCIAFILIFWTLFYKYKNGLNNTVVFLFLSNIILTSATLLFFLYYENICYATFFSFFLLLFSISFIKKIAHKSKLLLPFLFLNALLFTYLGIRFFQSI